MLPSPFPFGVPTSIPSHPPASRGPVQSSLQAGGPQPRPRCAPAGSKLREGLGCPHRASSESTREGLAPLPPTGFHTIPGNVSVWDLAFQAEPFPST